MRDIKRSKAARLYAFSNWIHTYGTLILFILVAIVTPFVTIPIVNTSHDLLCIPILAVDVLLVIVWCLTPEYKNIEQCQELMSEREYRKRERKNRKWLM